MHRVAEYGYCSLLLNLGPVGHLQRYVLVIIKQSDLDCRVHWYDVTDLLREMTVSKKKHYLLARHSSNKLYTT